MTPDNAPIQFNGGIYEILSILKQWKSSWLPQKHITTTHFTYL